MDKISYEIERVRPTMTAQELISVQPMTVGNLPHLETGDIIWYNGNLYEHIKYDIGRVEGYKLGSKKIFVFATYEEHRLATPVEITQWKKNGKGNT